MSNFDYIETGGAPIKAWTRGVPIEEAARKQIGNVARLPFCLDGLCLPHAGDAMGRQHARADTRRTIFRNPKKTFWIFSVPKKRM